MTGTKLQVFKIMVNDKLLIEPFLVKLEKAIPNSLEKDSLSLITETQTRYSRYTINSYTHVINLFNYLPTLTFTSFENKTF